MKAQPDWNPRTVTGADTRLDNSEGKPLACRCACRAVRGAILATIVATAGFFLAGCNPNPAASANAAQPAKPPTTSQPPDASLMLAASQLTALKIEPAGLHQFVVQKEGIGNIDFQNNVYFDNTLSVPVFPSRAGVIKKVFVELGDEVQAGQPLYSIETGGGTAGESAPFGDADSIDPTRSSRTPTNGDVRHPGQSGSLATSPAVNGSAAKSEHTVVSALDKPVSETDDISHASMGGPEIVVRSPIAGQVSSVNGTPGLSVRPGLAPAPCSIANVSTKWMLAKVNESDLPNFRVGQPIKVTVASSPNKVFRGRLSKIYPAVDPNTHRITLRAMIDDPGNELRSGMMAEFVALVTGPVASLAIPANGVVREGDNTLTVWVTTDSHRFVQRTVTTGLLSDGWVQVLSGLHRGELVVTDGAIFLDNMLHSAPSD